MNDTSPNPETLLAQLRSTPPADLYENTVVSAGAADRVSATDSPLGPVWLSWSIRGVTAVAPLLHFASVDEFTSHHRREVFEASALPADLGSAVMEGLESGDTSEVPVDLSGIQPFQQTVLQACSTIPVGQVRPYGWIAAEIGNPGSVRAVGTALGRNPIPLIVPCHRVVRSDGSVGQYAFGPERKQQLLVREGALLA